MPRAANFLRCSKYNYFSFTDAIKLLARGKWSHGICVLLLWHYRLWSFKFKDTKLEIYLPKEIIEAGTGLKEDWRQAETNWKQT